MISDYGKIYTVGHRDLRQLFDGRVVVQEKIDGSQFSAMVDNAGTLHVRSKGGPLDAEKDGSKGLFAPSIQHLLSVKDRMLPFWIYRFEAMSRPKHNVLAYARVPAGNSVLYDMFSSNVLVADVKMLKDQADALGVECVQTIHTGECSEADLPGFLKTAPQLGGALVEGVVVKNYALGLKGKFVADRFKEIMHNKPVRAPRENPVFALGQKYCSEARWEKAIAHLREAGKIGLEPTNADIGLIIREVQRDVIEECGPEIRDALFSKFAKDLRSAWIKGLPEWYGKRCS